MHCSRSHMEKSLVFFVTFFDQFFLVFSMEKTNKKTDQKKLEKTTKVFPYGNVSNASVDLTSRWAFGRQKFWRLWNECKVIVLNLLSLTLKFNSFWHASTWVLSWQSMLSHYISRQAISCNASFGVWKKKLKDCVDTWNRPLFRQTGMRTHKWHDSWSSRKFFIMKMTQ